MLFFQTPEFMFFLIMVLAFYYLLPRWRVLWMAAADLAFYALAGLGPTLLFLGVTLLTYTIGRRLTGPHKKGYLWVGVVVNVANLVFFKYTLFFFGVAEKLLHLSLIPKLPWVLELVLPVGISFYTFQFISYLVDVYQEKIPASRNFMIFWLFASFFPHVISGPIMRGGDLIPQMERLEKIKISEHFRLGLSYLALGLFKKIMIADYIAIYANDFFARGAALGTVETWIAAYLYTFQIYFDFSAYSEMAVGIAYLFGVRLNLNFQTPYLSANATEFWRRWHITLSTWIRDYLYIPLGGSRKGQKRKYINLFLAMSISGLWHGAAFTFIIWGMYHGLLLIAHNVYLKCKNRFTYWGFFKHWSYKVLSIFVFFHLICIGWVIFRASDLHQAVHMLKMMLWLPEITFSLLDAKFLILVLGLYLLHILERWIREHFTEIRQKWDGSFSAPLRAVFYTAFILLLILFSQGQASSFIYFKF